MWIASSRETSRQVAHLLEVELRDGDKVIAKANQHDRAVIAPHQIPTSLDPDTAAPVYASTETIQDPARYTVSLTHLGDIQALGSASSPHLYTVHVRLLRPARLSTKTRGASASAKQRSPIMDSR